METAFVEKQNPNRHAKREAIEALQPNRAQSYLTRENAALDWHSVTQEVCAVASWVTFDSVTVPAG
jgi:hypothetical protein